MKPETSKPSTRASAQQALDVALAAFAARGGEVTKLSPEPERHRNITRFSFSPLGTLQAVGGMLASESARQSLRRKAMKKSEAGAAERKRLRRYSQGKKLIAAANRLNRLTTI